MNYPCVVCDRAKLLRNLNRIADEMHAQGRIFAAVTKAICAEEAIIDVVNESRCDWIADSKIDNLARIHTGKKKFLIRIAQPSEAGRVVEHADVSFQSEPAVIRLLGEQARQRGRTHGVIVALDLGDLREGCFFEDYGDIRAAVSAVLEEPSLTFLGLGTNLGCFGGVKTTPDKLELLCELAQRLEADLSCKIGLISGMTTASQALFFSGSVPAAVNHGRFGEAWLTGYDSVDHCRIPEMEQGAFTLVAQLAEVKTKASKPIGEIGGDAFGNVVLRADKGRMRRGILDCGVQDIDIGFILPEDSRISIEGGSSDHTIVDLSLAEEYRVGDTIRFSMSYSAVMRAFTGKYVYKEFLP